MQAVNPMQVVNPMSDPAKAGFKLGVFSANADRGLTFSTVPEVFEVEMKSPTSNGLSIAIESGGQIGDIIDMCAPLREKAAKGEDAGTKEFLAEWMKKAETLIGKEEPCYWERSEQ